MAIQLKMAFLSQVLCQCLLFLVWSTCVRTYNVDLPSAVVHRGPSDSLFGFSVASHKDRGQSWALVGAPEASAQQPGVEKPGAVFRCSTEIPGQCQIIPFDRTGNNNASGRQIDNKSNQWFGATVRSSGPNGVVMACAPRYTWFTTQFIRREPVGTCYIARDSFREISEYSPCRTVNFGYHRQGSCQAGLGAAISPDGQRLFIGAVGSWYWQGQQFSVDITNPRVRSEIFRDYVTGEVFSQNLYSRVDVYATKEGPPTDDDSYMGYSVAVGEFNGDNTTDVVVGMPRGANLTGKILLFTSNLTSLHNITGQQLGSYFGYSLAVSDVNGDGRDDILVGAPLYTNYENTEGKYETGRVYVIYQTSKHTFRNWHVLDGEISRSRFGLSLSGAGDINRDGFGDFIVGSPYDGINGKGAIYIYHGSEAGVKTKAAQVIYAEDIQISLNTFGFSVSGNVDIDDNEYPDITVGAYDSNSAIVLRSRPVIYMNLINLSFETDSKQIDLEAKTCSLLDGTLVACVPLKLCLEYSGIGVEKNADFDVQYILDAKKAKTPRLYFLADETKSTLNNTISLTKGSQHCKSLFVYIKPKIRDKLTPIEAEVRLSIKNSTSVQSTTTRTRTKRSLTPVLHTEPASGRDQLNIQKNCGPDNICYPNMGVQIKSNVKNYILGSGGRVEVDVTVINGGEDAFEAMFHMIIPQGISYINVDRSGTDTSGDAAILCSPPAPDSNGGGLLRCDIGNPLASQKTINFRVLLQPLTSAASRALEAAEEDQNGKAKSSFDFYIEVNSTNAELEGDDADNVVNLSMPIQVETDIVIRGISKPDRLIYNRSAFLLEGQKHELDIGPEVTHLYDLGNRGPSDILAADVYILWPSKTLAGKDLLYLLEEPIVEGAGRCQPVDDVNALRLVLEGEETKFSKSSGSSGTVQSSSSSTRTSSTKVVGGKTITTYSSSSSSSSSSGSGTRSGASEEDIAVSRKATVVSSSSGSSSGSGASHGEGSGSRQTVVVSSSSRTGASGTGSATDNGRRAGGRVIVKEEEVSSRRYTGNSEAEDRIQGGAVETRIEDNDEDYYEEGYNSQETVNRVSSTRTGGSRVATDVRQETAIRNSNARGTGSGVSQTSQEEIQTSRKAGQAERTPGQRGVAGSGSSRVVYEERGTDSGVRQTSQEEIQTSRRTGQTERTSGQRGVAGSGSSRVVYEERGTDSGVGRTSQEETQTSRKAGQGDRTSGHRVVSGSGASRTIHDSDVREGSYWASGGQGGSSSSRQVTEEREITEGDDSSSSTFTSGGQGQHRGSSVSQTGKNRKVSQRPSQTANTHNSEAEEQEQDRGASSGTHSRTVTHTVKGSRSQNVDYDDNTDDLVSGIRKDVYTSFGTSVGENGARGTGSHSGRINQQGQSAGDRNRTATVRKEVYTSRKFTSKNSEPWQEETNVTTVTFDGGKATKKTHHSKTKNAQPKYIQGTTGQKINPEFLEGLDDWDDETGPGVPIDTRVTRSVDARDEALESELNCGATQCVVIKCEVGPLAKNDHVLFRVRSRVWVQTINEMGYEDAKISSKMVARVKALPYGIDPSYMPIKSEMVSTIVDPTDKELEAKPIPWWVIVLAALAGVLLLLFLVFLLWKLGFFKRKRPDNAEKEPLQNGDEAL